MLQGRTLDRLLNTHLHSDHCGGNAALERAYRCRTSIPAAEAAKVRDWDQDALSYVATGQQCDRFGYDDTWTYSKHIAAHDKHKNNNTFSSEYRVSRNVIPAYGFLRHLCLAEVSIGPWHKS